MDKEKLRKLQLTELDILKVVTEFCDKHTIVYSLYAGTALGAVRHEGFIPWDDDVDICMERDEYERFLKLWKDEEIQGYYLQGTDDINNTLTHSKIRKENTVLASKREYAMPGNHGIWIDIFPLDRVPDKLMYRILIYISASIRLVYTRGYPLTGKGKSMEAITKLMLMLPKSIKTIIKKKTDKVVTKYKKTQKNYHLISLSAQENLRRYFPGNMLEDIKKITFEGITFNVSSRVKEMLVLCYGDYMTLPPIEKQVCTHSPEILIFEDDKIA